MSELLSDGETVQCILNEGYSPKEIYDNDTTYLDSLYGKLYQAGLIFYFDTRGTGLIVVPTEPNQYTVWGCPSTEVTGADRSAVGTGKQNTIDILASCSDTATVAYRCSAYTLGGYSDWFLPSIMELNQMNYKLENEGFDAVVPLIYSWE